MAEELSVPFDRVTLIYCDTARTPDQAHTSGSQSHPTNFNHSNLAQAGATARELLFRMASEKLQVPVEQLTAADGVIRAQERPVEKNDIRATGGRKEIQPGSFRNRETQACQRMDCAGNAGGTAGHACDGRGPV